MDSIQSCQKAKPTVLVVGSNGQLAKALFRNCPQRFAIECWGRADVDVFNIAMLKKRIAKLNPKVLINAAAYTAVDLAEADVQAAFDLNAIAVENLASIARDQSIAFIHVSTDFVFDGKSSLPYRPESATNPLSVYGESKLKGELAVSKLEPQQAVVVRTAWVYSMEGKNFLTTMLRIMQERDSLSVVCDQIGTPTSADSLARVLFHIAARLISEKESPRGVELHHWTDAGVASWYDFAKAIEAIAVQLGLLESSIDIKPIATEGYPTPAKRPAYSVLDKSKTVERFGLVQSHWQEELKKCLTEMVRLKMENSR